MFGHEQREAAMAHAMEMPTVSDLQQAVRQIEKPDWVHDIEVVEDLDADGELAVWVWIVVGSEMPEQQDAQPVLAGLRQRIRGLLSEEAPGLWAYIRIREQS